MKINFIRKSLFNVFVCSMVLINTSLSADVCVDSFENKENFPFASPNKNYSPCKAGLIDSGLLKTPKSSPPPSPTKKSPTKPATLGLRNSNNVRTPTNSPNGSPTKGPFVSKIPTAGETSRPDVKKMQANFRSKLFDEPTIKNEYKHALDMSKQPSKPQIAQAPNYLCALPTPETAKKIDIAFKGASEQIVLPTSNYTLSDMLALRSESTVLNCSVIKWPEEKHYHMSLDLKKQKKQPIDEGKLKNILNKVEFPFRDVDTLGRFIVIRLNDPQVKQECSVSAEEMDLLKGYLEYGDEPLMHISLVKVNESKKQMSCVALDSNQVTIPVEPSLFQSAIQRAENKGKHIHMAGMMKTLSHAFFWLLHLGSERIHEHLKQFPTIDGYEDELYEFVTKRARLCLDNVAQIPAIGQHHILDEYGIDYDFTDKIGIKIDDKEKYPLNKQLVAELFSNIFLNTPEEVTLLSKEFGQVRKLLKFCIEKTKGRISGKESTIKSGIIKMEMAEDDLMGLFEAVNEELPNDIKEQYLKENTKDRLVIKDIQENLALKLIEYRFFGLDFDPNYFIQFNQQHNSLIKSIHDRELSQEAISDDFLDNLQKMSMVLSQGNYLSKKFTFQLGFDFKASVNSLPSFMCISESDSYDLQKKIASAMNEIIAINNEKLSKGVLETVTFSESKIPHAPFWNYYIRELQKHFDVGMRTMMFQFSELSHQAVEENANEREST
jgi:hypothetical protein